MRYEIRRTTERYNHFWKDDFPLSLSKKTRDESTYVSVAFVMLASDCRFCFVTWAISSWLKFNFTNNYSIFHSSKISQHIQFSITAKQAQTQKQLLREGKEGPSVY